MSNDLFLLIIPVAILGFVVFGLIILKKPVKDETNYKAKRYLLSPAELEFYKNLTKALEGRFLVMTKVRMDDLFYSVAKKENYWAAKNKVLRKHIDFVIVTPHTLEITAAIELDDSSHFRKENADRDLFKNKVFAQTGLPLFRFHVRGNNSASEIKAVLSKLKSN